MSNTTANYKATFILNTRGANSDVDTVIANLKALVEKTGCTIKEIKNLGRKDFVRVLERGHLGDVYVEVTLAGPASTPAAIREAFRLEKSVKRTFVQAA